jgi:hypothetical protein
VHNFFDSRHYFVDSLWVKGVKEVTW